MNTRTVVALIRAMYNDHATYPQLKLPKMQEERLLKLMKETAKD